MILDELAVQKQLTRWFIDSDPSTITLTPREKTPTASGGSAFVDQPPRKSQRFKLITMTDTTRPTPTAQGVERLHDFTLVGEFDAVVNVHDYWVDDRGTRYEVIELVPFNGYEVKALVTKHGVG
jgi:hypothetical protein